MLGNRGQERERRRREEERRRRERGGGEEERERRQSQPEGAFHRTRPEKSLSRFGNRTNVRRG